MVVTVEAPTRIHFGLLQMSRTYATAYMGLGGALSEPSWSLRIAASSAGDRFDDLPVELVDYARRVCRALRALTDFPPVSVRARKTVPPHVGLGAKTSFGCALLAGLVEFLALPGGWPRYRHVLGRGGASGIGIHSAVSGGMILDAGHILRPGDTLLPSSARPGETPPPVVARWDVGFLPPVVVARPSGLQGLHGPAEHAFFRERLPLPEAEVREVAAVALYELVPALTRQDARAFADGLTHLQGVGFKQAEWELQPDPVLALRAAATSHGATAVALSSLGPTLVVFADDPHRLADSLRTLDNVEASVSSFAAHGARVRACEGDGVDDYES
ncbi:hypothetical protein CcI49_00590 [Frankia sp. CcI49]|uniref:beta-ribofuranosylaminobenzene 5'-phosphate synthase family protein n=1 Tax=unclassified Frankia TaxID=2632575 RepID=UPI0006CA261F|nr:MULTISPECIES: beta-ribofuranosylaminobenzene 5'-phosphate synthase family protein [unclassified Frankia]KPM56584.1 hypothetical protein ACG83_01310 [Frankia sp. R43]ONH62590.1 hypothetical protein CcI49_00590 [Frankia sp. CcI49]